MFGDCAFSFVLNSFARSRRDYGAISVSHVFCSYNYRIYEISINIPEPSRRYNWHNVYPISLMNLMIC